MKEALKIRWLALLLVNFIVFSTPAGDCGSDLAIGFPLIGSVWDNKTHLFSFNIFFIALNLLLGLTFIFLFSYWLQLRKRFSSVEHVLAGAITLCYALSANVLVAIMWFMNADENFFVYYAWPYYFGSFPLFWILNLFKGTPLEVSRLEILFRMILLPNLVVIYFTFYGLLKFYRYLKDPEEQPATRD